MMQAVDLNPTAPAIFLERAGTLYRPWLRRNLFPLATDRRVVAFCCYNPSTAGADENDPSVTRMVGFANAAGATDLVVVNTMTAVGADPDELAHLEDPVGPLADDAIRLAAALVADTGGVLIAAWGAPKGQTSTRTIATARMEAIRAMGLPWHVLRFTAEFYPEHPLYLPAALRPQPWEGMPPQGLAISHLRRQALAQLVAADGPVPADRLWSGERTAAGWLVGKGLAEGLDGAYRATGVGRAAHQVLSARRWR